MTHDPDFDAAAAVRQIMGSTLSATLATLGPTGSPFASLVTVATTDDGGLLMLLSELAEHTRNLKRDARASLLLVAAGGEGGDPLAGARVTLVGTVAAGDNDDNRRHFLTRHPEAERIAAFADFSLYRFRVERAHLVASFGRIADLDATSLTFR